MKKIIIIVITCAIVLYAVWSYATRPIVQSDVSVENVSSKLPAGSEVMATYKISQKDSLVRFTMNELLNKSPFLVVGTTTQIAGEIGVKDNGFVIGDLTIDARTLETDNSKRNSAIVRFILKSENPGNEYITFKALKQQGVTTIAEGTPNTFTVTGDLTISGITKPATFTVTATTTADQITALAQTTIKRTDFNLNIPNIPFVANVDDEFPITVSIVAPRIMK